MPPPVTSITTSPADEMTWSIARSPEIWWIMMSPGADA